MPQAYLLDAQLSKFGKTDSDYQSLSYETANHLLKRNPEFRPEFLIFSAMAPEKYTGEIFLPAKIKEDLGLPSLYAIRTETASSSGASAIHLGRYLILSGRFRRGIIIATEVMSRLPREENNLLLGSVLSETQRKFAMSMAQGGAMTTTRYLHEYGYSRKDLFLLSKKLHDNGLENPIAHIKKKLTEEEYFASPIFSSPLCLYDISPLSDGSCAILLESDSNRIGADKSKISVLGTGHGLGHVNGTPGGLSFPSSVEAFGQAYKEAGITPSDVRVAELHDAFTPFELIGAEDAGLFPRGKALKFVEKGISDKRGKLPINPSGGLKTRGHPVGVSGLAQIAELFSFMKESGHPIGLALSIGGLGINNFATILKLEN
ncbi:thiolase, C-terminal domain protein [Leptospira inadai serovar Lyme str. 10]|uniref:Thiolase, C-terminal domain protein n=2 Tax=Leptospira inadai serovar Lyme TaxID=293084 RepID=V6HWC6_9LEPT|nr:thiolase family protein [Leptospira inadai]EQA37239.1 thiolase, C-terminal domain protein [Leptospira inadai serovar Lyme str. 10]PNV73026.1 acetyl-CoA acetyltransferase [Leptospira inadai serovar Lyme]